MENAANFLIQNTNTQITLEYSNSPVYLENDTVHVF